MASTLKDMLIKIGIGTSIFTLTSLVNPVFAENNFIENYKVKNVQKTMFLCEYFVENEQYLQAKNCYLTKMEEYKKLEIDGTSEVRKSYREGLDYVLGELSALSETGAFDSDIIKRKERRAEKFEEEMEDMLGKYK